MRTDRLRASFLTGAVALAVALVLHATLHALIEPAEARSLAHVLELLVAAGIFVPALAALGAANTTAERRRRLALVRAGLPRSTGAVVAIALAEAAIAGGLCAVEGTTGDLNGLIAALVCAAIALVLTLVGLRAARERVIAMLRWWIARIDHAPPATGRATFRPTRASALHERALRRLRFRGPPLLLRTV